MSIESAIERIYATFDGPGEHFDYHQRHATASLNVLTVRSTEEAAEVVKPFVDSIRGKTVIELGAGVGFLSMELARHAAQVWAIEADPAWSWTFTRFLYKVKPRNLSWIFGSAETVCNWLRADVAVIRTRSGVQQMVSIAERTAETIVLSVCEEPIIAPRGSKPLSRISEWIDQRVTRLTAKAEELLREHPELDEAAFGAEFEKRTA